MDDPLDAWFAREVLVHEEALVRYIARRWKAQSEVHDLRQDTYIRVYEAAARARPHAPKSFLFTTARNLMTDRLRRERVVSIESRADLEELNVLVDEVTPERHVSAHQDFRDLAHAFDRLPPRCREVVWLHRVQGLSQKEVAGALNIGVPMVEKHIAKAMRRLADALFSHEPGESARSTPADVDGPCNEDSVGAVLREERHGD